MVNTAVKNSVRRANSNQSAHAVVVSNRGRLPVSPGATTLNASNTPKSASPHIVNLNQRKQG